MSIVHPYDAPCIDCGGPKPSQRVGFPRLRCLDCTFRAKQRQNRERTEAKARALLAVPPDPCVICNGPIARVTGRHSREKYCSPECDREARLRLQRFNRGGLRYPARSVALLLRTRPDIATLTAAGIAAQTLPPGVPQVRRSTPKAAHQQPATGPFARTGAEVWRAEVRGQAREEALRVATALRERIGDLDLAVTSMRGKLRGGNPIERPLTEALALTESILAGLQRIAHVKERAA